MIYDKASLVQIPSGYKSGTLYNVLPNDADGDFDFTRGSTATRVDENGLIETIATGTPRLNYPLLDGVVQDNPTLLLEPQRTNLFNYSEEFSNSVWAKTRTNITSNVAVSPDGTQNADELSLNSDNDRHYFLQDSTTTNQEYTQTIFIKDNGARYFQITGSTGFASYWVNFDVQEGVITRNNDNVDATIENYGNNWYRIGVTLISSGTTQSRIIFAIINEPFADRLPSFTGVSSESFYIWGAQFEAGSYPTSYIPSLTGSQTTRSVDVARGAGTAADFNDSEGVLYANIAAIDDAETNNRRLGLTKNNTFEGLRIQYNGSTIGAVLYDGSTNQYSQSFTFSKLSLFAKVAFKYKASDFALWINGFEYGAEASGNTLPEGTLNDLSFDYVNSNFFFAKTKEVIVFIEALSDTELEALTSYDSFNEMATEQLYTIE